MITINGDLDQVIKDYCRKQGLTGQQMKDLAYSAAMRTERDPSSPMYQNRVIAYDGANQIGVIGFGSKTETASAASTKLMGVFRRYILELGDQNPQGIKATKQSTPKFRQGDKVVVAHNGMTATIQDIVYDRSGNFQYDVQYEGEYATGDDGRSYSIPGNERYESEDQLRKKQFTANKQYSIRSKAGEEIGVGTVIEEHDDGVVVKYAKGIMTNTTAKVDADQVVDPEAEQKKALAKKATIRTGGREWTQGVAGRWMSDEFTLNGFDFALVYDPNTKQVLVASMPDLGVNQPLLRVMQYSKALNSLAAEMSNAKNYVEQAIEEQGA